MKAALIFSLSLVTPYLSATLPQANPLERPSAHIVVTPDSCGFDPWLYTISHEPELFPALTTVYPEQKIRVLGFIKSKQSDKKIHLTCKMKIIGPDGLIYAESDGSLQAIADGKPLLIDSLAYEITFKEQHPIGKYRIELEIKDIQSGQTILVKRTMSLSKFVIQGTFENEAEYAEWLNHYYHDYNLPRATSAYLYLATVKFDWKTFNENARMNIQAAFYDTLYANNKWILPHMESLYKNGYPETQKKIVFIFSRLGHYPRSLFVGINDKMMAFSKWAKDLQIDDTSKQVHTALQIDIDWAQFFASGKYKYVKRIATLLNYADDLNTPSDALLDPGEQINNATLLNAAKWSLASNCRTHPLVKAYCEYIAIYGNLKPEATKLLHEILSTAHDD